MILFESMVPYHRRATVAGLIKSACVTCEPRKRFYARAAAAGLAAADALAAEPGHNPTMLALLRGEIDDIASELLEKGQR
jgi:hypothetical protein